MDREETDRLLQQLKDNQVELEKNREELNRSRAELDKACKKYLDRLRRYIPVIGVMA